MLYLLCRHLRTNGTQCDSPSLRGAPYCFFHARLHGRHNAIRQAPETQPPPTASQHIQLAPLEDCESIQISLSVVINALATGQLETKRATALLYGLQLASINARRLPVRPYAPRVVRNFECTPDGIDLAEPGATGEMEDESFDEDKVLDEHELLDEEEDLDEHYFLDEDELLDEDEVPCGDQAADTA
jgi:hypothetical protein